jgi:hypothetical protein
MTLDRMGPVRDQALPCSLRQGQASRCARAGRPVAATRAIQRWERALLLGWEGEKEGQE